MDGSAVKWLRSGKVAHLEFSRPAKRNALRLSDWVALSAALDAIRKAEVQSLVIGSAVPDIFCAGSDLGEVEALAAQPEDAVPFAAIMAQVMRQLSKGPTVTIAAISGACHGAGVAIAMACDIRIASPSATFSIPPAKFGFSYPTGDVRRLVELVGIGQAARLLYSAETLDATEAKNIGLIEVVDTDATGAARALAGKIAENSVDSIALLKSVLVQSELGPDCDHQFLAGFRSADFLSFVNRKRRQD